MENPNHFQFPPNQTQNNPGPINAGRNASTLPKTENSKGHRVEAQTQLPKRKSRNTVKAKPLVPDLNEHPFKCILCGKTFGKEMALCGHMRMHPHRLWKGQRPPPNWESFNLNEVPKDEDSEI